ncbi:MAG TPA: hypothetical protein VM099_08490 [Gemmatimonadaceae bacterium]|nr:hypothetical protein [Gemmatimonadaceae bacterium]
MRTRFRLLPAALFALGWYTSGCSTNEPAAPDSEHVDSPSTETLRLEALSPTQLQGTVDTPADPVPTVVVRDKSGKPVRGITVTFSTYRTSPIGGEDIWASWSAITGSTGIANPGEWNLSVFAGTQILEASILGAHLFDADSGAGRVVVFRAAASPGPAVWVSKAYGDKQLGLTNERMEPPQVHVVDRFGNRVPGPTTVTFTVTAGGGSLGNGNVEVLSLETRDGVASPDRWTLGTSGGINSVVASVPGLNSVTFTAEALDPGPLVRYDLEPESVRGIVSASIALGENGIFELKDVEWSDAFPGEFFDRRLGRYTLSGTRIVLTYSTGETDEGTLVGDKLSVQYTKLNWHPHVPQEWRFVKRN